MAQSCQMIFPDYVQFDEDQLSLCINVKNYQCTIFLDKTGEQIPVVSFDQSISYQAGIQLMDTVEDYLTPDVQNLLPLVTCVIQNLETLQMDSAQGLENHQKVSETKNVESTSLDGPRRKPQRDVSIAHYRKSEVCLTYEGKPVIATIPREVNKSTFFALAKRVTSLDDVNRFINFIDQQFPDAAHNMAAWRLTDKKGNIEEGTDEDGEAGAGSFMLFVLQKRRAENVVIVCTRFFGGVLLGPLRFRLISEHTAQAIQLLENK